MRTIETTVYKFSELSAKAKQRAKDDSAEVWGYSSAEEAIESLKKLAEHFDGKLKDYAIDFFACSHSSATWDMPEMTRTEIKRRLATLGGYNRHTGRGDGDCVLTGVCWDEDAIDGFRAAFREGARSLSVLMGTAFAHWLKAVQADCEDQFTDETFGELCEANDYEFFENGKLIPRGK